MIAASELEGQQPRGQEATTSQWTMMVQQFYQNATVTASPISPNQTLIFQSWASPSVTASYLSFVNTTKYKSFYMKFIVGNMGVC